MLLSRQFAGARVSVLGAAPSGDRLHSAAAAKAAHIERLRAELQATELAGCTFAPQLTTAGSACSGLTRDIHDCIISFGVCTRAATAHMALGSGAGVHEPWRGMPDPVVRHCPVSRS